MSPAAKKTVDGYIENLGDWRADVVARVRELVREAAPEASEDVKWSQPVYSSGGPVCFIKAFKNHVNFGFWRGAQLEDPEGLLEGSGEKMRHVKLKSLDDVPSPEQMGAWLRSAIELNRTHGDPTKG